MDNDYNFERLRIEILRRSLATEWRLARREWRLVDVSEAETPETCLCGHYPIIELCSIENSKTANTVEVGNVCVKRFLGLRSDLIFASLRRIRMDLDKSLGPDATAFFHEQGLVNQWEYQFQQSTMRKRNLSARQVAARRSLNAKVLASIKRRGLP